MIEILRPGARATVQDLGRPGYAALGVPHSGAFDTAALRVGNRLVGNQDDAAGIEATLGGLVIRTDTAVTVAVTGASCQVATDTVAGAWGAPVSLPAGTTLSLGTPTKGLRCYLAVRGGFAVEPVLGSRSHDTLSGLGPAPLGVGDRLALETAPDHAVSGLDAFIPRVVGEALRVRFGPRDDWFTADATNALLKTEWLVRADSDRVGVRLDGPALQRRVGGELPSEPVRPGAIQVPGDGRPIIFGPDAPVTGGYPVIAVVLDLDRAAQLRPGDTVRFTQWQASAGR